jgi:hypothetical protein
LWDKLAKHADVERDYFARGPFFMVNTIAGYGVLLSVAVTGKSWLAE